MFIVAVVPCTTGRGYLVRWWNANNEMFSTRMKHCVYTHNILNPKIIPRSIDEYSPDSYSHVDSFSFILFLSCFCTTYLSFLQIMHCSGKTCSFLRVVFTGGTLDLSFLGDWWCVSSIITTFAACFSALSILVLSVNLEMNNNNHIQNKLYIDFSFAGIT